MRQLMSKEVLYEPLKELNDKASFIPMLIVAPSIPLFLWCILPPQFPGYMQEHEATLSTEDKTRYQNQLEKVTQIVAVFEDPSYTDGDQEKGAKVVALMNEVG